MYKERNPLINIENTYRKVEMLFRSLVLNGVNY